MGWIAAAWRNIPKACENDSGTGLGENWCHYNVDPMLKKRVNRIITMIKKGFVTSVTVVLCVI